MFGYLNVEKDTLEEGQRGLWQTFMCGLCFSTKKIFGNYPRIFIGNDINFFNVLFHSVTDTDVELDNKRCFSHPLKKRTVLKTNDFTDALAAANVLLTYWNVYDDVLDDNSASKKIVLKSLKKAYKRAKDNFPQMDEMLSARYEQLQQLEKSQCGSIDRTAHSFASLSQDFCSLMLGEKRSEYVLTLCYNLGKWIYLIDALDDAEKDLKEGKYNVFAAAYNATRFDDLGGHIEEIRFVMYSALNRIAQSFNDLNLTKYACILKNVLYESIRNTTAKVLCKYKQTETE